MNQSIVELQEMLNNNGANLTIDGDLRAKTTQAIDALNIPVWVKIAMKEIGTHEIIGGKHSPRVLEYHSVSGGFKDDETPWCGSFVNWVMKQAGFKTTVDYPAIAKSWLNFGVSAEPRVGALAIKSRKGGGHIGIIVAIDKNTLYIIGGNQGDEVNIRKYRKSDFIDFRVPFGYTNVKYANLSLTAQTNTQEA